MIIHMHNHDGSYKLHNTIGYGSAESLKSILYESILMKDFDHPNVLNVLGVGFNPDGGLPFIVLPYMANGDLKTYLKSKRQKATTVDYLPEVHITALCGMYVPVISYYITTVTSCASYFIGN